MRDEDRLWQAWPTSVSFTSVSPMLKQARLVGLFAIGSPLILVTAGLSWLWWGGAWAIGIGAALLAAMLVRAALVGRAVRAWGYAERDDDLVIRHGVWTKRLSIIPYGRMQFIDVSANPFERVFGLATVSLHTAAAGSDSTVPGLAPEAAAGLRDRLAERARTEREGL